MKRKDITKASSVFKKTEQERIGYFHNDISLSSVAVAFRQKSNIKTGRMWEII